MSKKAREYSDVIEPNDLSRESTIHVLQLLAEYARELNGLAREVRQVQQRSLQAWSNVFFLLSIIAIGLLGLYYVETHLSSFVFPIVTSFFILITNYGVRTFEQVGLVRRQKKDVALEVKRRVPSIEMLIRLASQIKEHGTLFYLDSLELEIRLSEAESALEILHRYL